MIFLKSLACFLALHAPSFARRSQNIPDSQALGQWRVQTDALGEIERRPTIRRRPAERDARRQIVEILRGGGKKEKGSEDSGKKELKPFKRGNPQFNIDKKIEKVLEEGNVWENTKVIGHTAHAKAVMDVDATKDTVWGQLLDFNNYGKKVPKLKSCKIYEKHREGFSAERIKAKFVNPVVPGVKLEYYIDHTYESMKSAITWTLDDRYKNDFKEVQGHWHVRNHPSDPSKARVFYEISTVVPSWFPKWLGKKLTKSAVNDATTWVKKESELAQSRKSGNRWQGFR